MCLLWPHVHTIEPSPISPYQPRRHLGAPTRAYPRPFYPRHLRNQFQLSHQWLSFIPHLIQRLHVHILMITPNLTYQLPPGIITPRHLSNWRPTVGRVVAERRRLGAVAGSRRPCAKHKVDVLLTITISVASTRRSNQNHKYAHFGGFEGSFFIILWIKKIVFCIFSKLFRSCSGIVCS